MSFQIYSVSQSLHQTALLCCQVVSSLMNSVNQQKTFLTTQLDLWAPVMFIKVIYFIVREKYKVPQKEKYAAFLFMTINWSRGGGGGWGGGWGRHIWLLEVFPQCLMVYTWIDGSAVATDSCINDQTDTENNE